MPLPVKVTVRGTFVKTTGVIPTTDDVYETGTIRIVSDQWVKSPSLDHLVAPHEVKAELNSVGYFELSVISTDDPLWTPVNRTLVIKESLSGGSRTYRIVVPYNTPGLVLDLADVSPVQNPSSPLQYVLLNTVQAKGDLIVGTQANAVARLPIGTNSQVLSVDTSTGTGLKWVTGAGGGGIPPAIINAKGDLIVGISDDTPDRLGVGTNGQVLTADSAETTGVKWATPAGGGAVSSVFGRTGAVVAESGDYTKSQVGLPNVDNTSDANKPVSTATQTALNAKADLVGGVVPTAQIPAIAITDYLGTVANQAAMLALVGQKGDWAIRTDTSVTWVITGNDPTQLADWTALSYPGAPVTSVNGQTGVVVLAKGDVGLGNVDNTSDADKPVSTAQQAALNLKANSASPTFTGLVTANAGITQNGRYLSVASNLTDAATIAVNASLSNDFAVTLGAAVGATRQLGTPTNAVGNMRIMIAIRQDAVGGRALTYNASWRFSTSVPVPLLSTAANAVDLLFARYNSTDAVWEVIDFVKASGPGGYVPNTLVDAKGDLIVGTADNVPDRMAVGTDGEVLRAASAQATGLDWTALAFRGAWAGATVYERGDLVTSGGGLFGASAGAAANVAPYTATNLLTGTPTNTDTTDTNNYEIFSYIEVSQRIRMTAITFRKVATQTNTDISVRLWDRDISTTTPIIKLNHTVSSSFAGEVVVPLEFDLLPGKNYAVSTTIGLGAGAGFVFNPAFAFPLISGSVTLSNAGRSSEEIIAAPTLGDLYWVGIQWQEPNASWSRVAALDNPVNVLGQPNRITVNYLGTGQWQVTIPDAPSLADPFLDSPNMSGTSTFNGRSVNTPDVLTDAATIAVDAALGNQFTVTLTANRTLGNPSNSVHGQEIMIAIRQDGTGGRTLAYSADWRFNSSVPEPVLSTAINATDYLFARYNGTDSKWDAIAFIQASATAPAELAPMSYPIDAYGFFSITGDIGTFHNSSNTGNNATVIARLYVPAGKAINVLGCLHMTAGTYSGSAGTNNGMGIYTSAGVLVQTVKPGTGTWATAAPAWKFFTLGTPIAAQGTGRYVYVSILVEGYSAEPNIMYNSVDQYLLKGGNGVGAHRRHFFESGVTDFPASFNPDTYGNDTSGYLPLFVLG